MHGLGKIIESNKYIYIGEWNYNVKQGGGI